MRLLVDAMCGKLARYLRMCGHDAAYTLARGVEDDAAVLSLAAEEDRRLVTRDADLAARAERAFLVRSTDVVDQLAELRAAGLSVSLSRPERCGRCNGRLVRVPAGRSSPDYAPDPAERRVWRCSDCGQHFWRGSHWDDVAARIADR